MDAIALEENSPRTPTVPGRQLEDLPRVATALAAPTVVAALVVMVMLVAGRRVCGGGDRGGRGHADSHVTGVSRGGYDARHRIEEIRRNKSSTAGDNDGFPAISSRLL
jgi:hypothetical protein